MTQIGLAEFGFQLLPEICDKVGNLIHFWNSATKLEFCYKTGILRQSRNSATFLEFCDKVGILVFHWLRYSAMFAVYELLAPDN